MNLLKIKDVIVPWDKVSSVRLYGPGFSAEWSWGSYFAMITTTNTPDEEGTHQQLIPLRGKEEAMRVAVELGMEVS